MLSFLWQGTCAERERARGAGCAFIHRESEKNPSRRPNFRYTGFSETRFPATAILGNSGHGPSGFSASLGWCIAYALPTRHSGRFGLHRPYHPLSFLSLGRYAEPEVPDQGKRTPRGSPTPTVSILRRGET